MAETFLGIEVVSKDGGGGSKSGTGTDFYDANLKKVKTVPYKHNYGYFFTSGPNTWHGMEKKEIKKERRCIQINYVTFPTDWKVK